MAFAELTSFSHNSAVLHDFLECKDFVHHRRTSVKSLPFSWGRSKTQSLVQIFRTAPMWEVNFPRLSIKNGVAKGDNLWRRDHSKFRMCTHGYPPIPSHNFEIKSSGYRAEKFLVSQSEIKRVTTYCEKPRKDFHSPKAIILSPAQIITHSLTRSKVKIRVVIPGENQFLANSSWSFLNSIGSTTHRQNETALLMRSSRD